MLILLLFNRFSLKKNHHHRNYLHTLSHLISLNSSNTIGKLVCSVDDKLKLREVK